MKPLISLSALNHLLYDYHHTQDDQLNVIPRGHVNCYVLKCILGIFACITFFASCSPPAPVQGTVVIPHYIGDLSIKIDLTGSPEYDNCSQNVKTNLKVTVQSSSGNIPPVFAVNLFNNGQPLVFHSAGTHQTLGGGLLVSLGANGTKTFTGYIDTRYELANSAVPRHPLATHNMLHIKASITVLPIMTITDKIFSNNAAELHIPQEVFFQTNFDNLNAVEMGTHRVISGYLNGSFQNLTFGSNNSRIGFGGGILDIIGKRLILVKAGCLPYSGKPYYYMTISENEPPNNYLSYSPDYGMIDGRESESREENQRWIFTRVPGGGENSYFIYNMSLRANQSMEVQYDSEYFIGAGVHNDISKKQVFKLTPW